jgi:hypothetical protein
LRIISQFGANETDCNAILTDERKVSVEGEGKRKGTLTNAEVKRAYHRLKSERAEWQPMNPPDTFHTIC